VLEASRDTRGQAILETAHHLLITRAGRISDEKLRRSFLENVVAHRDLVQAFAQGQEATPRMP
jgi:hypothetical protein